MAADEWRNCVDWLVKCQILPADHKATRQDATAFELAQALRDGVLLCHLLNTLQPGCIDMKDFSSRPQMSQFLCMKNIRTFLQTCTSAFGLDARDLFKPNDLFDVKDFRKVLNTLSTLSKSDPAQRRFSGFPPDSRQNTHGDEEDIYGNLQALAIENDIEDQEEIYDTVYQEDEEKIYEDLLGQTRMSAAQVEPLTKRDHCIKELLDTESNYKDALKMVVNHFIKPLHQVLPSSDRDIIFAYIENLLEVHTELHEKLNRSVTHGQPRLSDIFIHIKSKLLVYGDFCSNLPKAQDRIDKVCENDMIRQKIQECERQANEGKFRLRDLLHVPMQRVLKYHLLMRELIKTTDKSSSDREGLEDALEAMQDLSLYVNEVKRDHEGLQVIEEIQNSISDLRMPQNTSLKDYGRFQKDGELKVMSHTDNRQRTRHIFLFDKVMLMCKAKMVDKLFWGDTYNYKEAIALGEYRIDDSAVGQKGVQRGWNFPFIMVKQDKSNAYTFYVKTGEQRDKWCEAVTLALDNSHPAAGRNFIMSTFDKPRECDVCGKLLRGVFFQGYLCADSKKAVHKECIGKPFQTNPPRRPPPSNPNPRSRQVLKAEAGTMYRGVPAPPHHLKPPLFFAQSDVIEIISKPEAGWWKGRLRGEEGYFPSCYVTERKPIHRQNTYLHVSPGGSPGGTLTNGSEPRSPPPRNYVTVADLNQFAWYVGEMERSMAQKMLDPLPDGTFLIRVTTNPTRQGELSLSIKYSNAVRHIKVMRGGDSVFYLAQHREFSSVQDLVDFYQETELADSFPEVRTTLKLPYKKAAPGPRLLGHAVAIYDYAPTSTTQITLKVNDRVAILSKTGQDKGWWKGENLRSKRIGYFPLAYVNEEEDW